MDISGEHQEHLDHSLVKTRLNNQMERIDDGKVNQRTLVIQWRAGNRG